MIRRQINAPFAAALVVGVLAAFVPTQVATAGSSDEPSPRCCMGMAYDAAHGQVVLFGGVIPGFPPTFLGDTWTWDGTHWTQRTPAHHPFPRESMGIAYDAARGQVVLFGGGSSNGQFLGDTWTWDGSDWTKRTPAHHPSARTGI